MTMAKTDKRQDSRRKKSDEVQDLVMNRTELLDTIREMICVEIDRRCSHHDSRKSAATHHPTRPQPQPKYNCNSRIHI